MLDSNPEHQGHLGGLGRASRRRHFGRAHRRPRRPRHRQLRPRRERRHQHGERRSGQGPVGAQRPYDQGVTEAHARRLRPARQASSGLCRAAGPAGHQGQPRSTPGSRSTTSRSPTRSSKACTSAVRPAGWRQLAVIRTARACDCRDRCPRGYGDEHGCAAPSAVRHAQREHAFRRRARARGRRISTSCRARCTRCSAERRRQVDHPEDPAAVSSPRRPGTIEIDGSAADRASPPRPPAGPASR